MGGGVGVKNDDVVEVGADALEAFDDLLCYCNGPAWGGAAASRDNKPFEELVGRVEGGYGNDIPVDGDPVERRHKIEQESLRHLPKELRSSSTWGMGS